MGQDRPVLVGGHELLETIGSGGAGVVYRARSPRGDFVAVKVLREPDKGKLLRFDRERRLQGSLGQEDGFVPVLEIGESPSGPFIVMPLVTGGTLRDRLRRGPLSVEETVTLGRSLAKALGRIHARGIIHRDLKPENVLFTSAGQPLITDLGLAKHFERGVPGGSGSIELTRPGALLGTAGYMPAEQMLDSTKVGPTADVFSLGVVLYECLAGAPAFTAGNLVDLVVKVETGDLRPLRSWRPDVPRWLVSIIERCLARSPAARFAHGAALEAALAEGASGRRRTAARVALIASPVVFLVAIGAVLVGGGGAPPSPPKTPPPPPVVPRPVTRDTPEEAPAVLALVARAEEFRRARDLDSARKLLRDALAKDPRSIVARRELAYEEIARRDADAALTIADAVVADWPRSAEAWLIRANIRSARAEFALARRDLDRAIELEPMAARPWSARGSARSNLGDHEGALVDSLRAVELDPSSSELWANLGFVKGRKGDRAGMIAAETRALDLDPRNASAYSNRAVARLSDGDLAGAIADLDSSIALEPSAVAYGNRASVRDRARGDLRLVLDDLTRSLDLDDSSDAMWQFRGSVKQRLGDKRGAIEDFTAAIERGRARPRLVEAYAHRCELFAATGDRARAKADAKKVLELAPDSPQARAVKKLLANLGE